MSESKLTVGISFSSTLVLLHHDILGEQLGYETRDEVSEKMATWIFRLAFSRFKGVFTNALPDPLLKSTSKNESSPQFCLFTRSENSFSASSFVLVFPIICLHILCPHGFAMLPIMTIAPEENVPSSAFFISANVSKSRKKPLFSSRTSFKAQLSSSLVGFYPTPFQLLYSLYNPIRRRMPPIICTMPPIG